MEDADIELTQTTGSTTATAAGAVTLIAISLIGLLLSLLCGCGGGGGAALEALTIFPEDFTCRVGDRIDMTAQAMYTNDVQKIVTQSVNWETSNQAVGNINTNGQFTAVSSGAVSLSASFRQTDSNSVGVQVTAVPSLPTKEYWPLHVNNQWKYSGHRVTPDAVSPRAEEVTLTLLISRQVVRNGRVWYDMLVKGTDPEEPPGHQLLRHRPAGLMQYDTSARIPFRLLDATLQAGTTWEHPQDPDRTFEIVSTDARVQVPAGSYDNCIEVVSTDARFDPSPPNIVRFWYKSGVGVVLEKQFRGNTLINEQELVNFEPG